MPQPSGHFCLDASWLTIVASSRNWCAECNFTLVHSVVAGFHASHSPQLEISQVPGLPVHQDAEGLIVGSAPLQ